MGEWSRRVGEVGEDIVSKLLLLFGWGNAKRNLEINCVKNEKHALPNTKSRNTHGLDCFISYHSQLHARVLDHLVISSKYTSVAYPDNPASAFKGHFRDLAHTLECFRLSEVRQAANKSFSNVDMARDIGVIFWLSDASELDHDIISKISSVRKMDEYNFDTVYVIDNCKANFLYSAINTVKDRFIDCSTEFLYFNTGRNYNPTKRESSGNILPAEYINSNVLPFKVVEPGGTKKMVLAINEKFSKSGLMRAIGLCQDLTADFAAGIVIMFPDYNKLKHENDVFEAKLAFTDQRFTESVQISAITSTFRG